MSISRCRHPGCDVEHNWHECKSARENLDLTRERFAAGVTGSVEVKQAEETVATADLDYITSLLPHNLAKLSLTKALGGTETKLDQYLSISKAKP
jgi:outer membrane protein TolC